MTPISQTNDANPMAFPDCRAASEEPAAMMSPRIPRWRPTKPSRAEYRGTRSTPTHEGLDQRKSFGPPPVSRGNGRRHRDRTGHGHAADRRRRRGPRPRQGRPDPEGRLHREGPPRRRGPRAEGPPREARPRHRHDADPLWRREDPDDGWPRPGPEPHRHEGDRGGPRAVPRSGLRDERRSHRRRSLPDPSDGRGNLHFTGDIHAVGAANNLI